MLSALPLLALATAASQPAQQPAAQDSLARVLDAIVAPAFANRASGGAVLVARGNRVLFRRAYGFADIALDVPMRPDHVFLVGSITKEFTGAAIMRLAADGRLSLDDDVRKYVPDVNTHGKRITIEQVLTHTSGLASLVDLEAFDSLARHKYSVAGLLALTRNEPLHFEPGAAVRIAGS